MTLSNQGVIDQLAKNFVCGWKNIRGKTPYAGSSNTHLPSYAAEEVSNCAGHHNVQMFFLTSDGRVLHCLPGFWNPKNFLQELELAVSLGQLYFKSGISAAERNKEYLDLHLRHALEHTQDLRDHSYHQGFDKMDLEKRKESDFQRKEGFIASGLKTPDQVMHERMAERPFVPFAAFEVSRYIDMGIKQYSYDYGIPGKTRPKTGRPMGSMPETKKSGARSSVASKDDPKS